MDYAEIELEVESISYDVILVTMSLSRYEKTAHQAVTFFGIEVATIPCVSENCPANLTYLLFKVGTRPELD